MTSRTRRFVPSMLINRKPVLEVMRLDRSFTMNNNVVSLPDVERISRLITAISDYAVKSAREQWTQKMYPVYQPPRLRCWDESNWIQLTKDWEVVNYLLSDLAGAWLLMRSLHFCFCWYGQAEIDRLQSMGKAIEANSEQNGLHA